MFERRYNKGNIPTVHVTGETFIEAWEKALVFIWDNGVSIPTKHDQRDSKGNILSPPSYDSTVVIEILNPLAEPRVPKNLPDGLEGLMIYAAEVIQGIHDDKVDQTGKSTKWPYSYHQRLAAYPLERNGEKKYIDQIEIMLQKLSGKDPFDKRIQATTWIPDFDAEAASGPCLQNVQPRMTRNEKGTLVLNMNTYWRSRDVYKAVPENDFALIEFQRLMAQEVSIRRGEEVLVGRHDDIIASLHIYGAYFEDTKNYVEKIKADPLGFSKRAYNTQESDVYIGQTMETKYLIMLDKDYNLRPGDEKPKIKDNWDLEKKQCSIILPNEDILVCKDHKIFRQNNELYKENDMKWFWD